MKMIEKQKELQRQTETVLREWLKDHRVFLCGDAFHDAVEQVCVLRTSKEDLFPTMEDAVPYVMKDILETVSKRPVEALCFPDMELSVSIKNGVLYASGRPAGQTEQNTCVLSGNLEIHDPEELLNQIFESVLSETASRILEKMRSE